MGKKHDKKAEPAAAKTPKGTKIDKAVKKFRKLEGKLWTREYLLKIAEFDGATIAPANGAAARADAMGTLAGEHHKLLTSEKSVKLVHSLARETVAGGKIDDPQLLDEIRVLGRDQREASVIPTEEAEAWTRLTCEADAVWHKAKTANDWASFEPYVDRIVAQLKHQAELMDPKRDPYDVWLDQYERGLSAKSFDAFCDEVKATVAPLVHAIGERGQQPAADFLHARVPEAAQRAMSFDLMKLVGLDLNDTTLAFTEHPFSEGFAVGDARIATHIYEDDCISNVYSIIHEAGHAMYELGVWYEDGRYRGAMQRIQIVDPDYAAHLDSLKNAGRKLAKSQHPRISDFYFKARPSASAQTIEVVATDRFGRRYSERITLEKAQ